MNIAIVGGRSLLKKELQEKLDQQEFSFKRAGECDFQDVVACEEYLVGVDCVIHTGLDWRKRKPDEVYNQISDLSCIVNEALKSNIRIILISDALSMGYHKKTDLYNESEVWNQTIKWSFSGFMYHLAERELARGIAEGLVGVTIRPSILIGSEEDGEVFRSLNSSLKNNNPSDSNYLNIVSRADVINLIDKLLRLDKIEFQFVTAAGHSITEQKFAEQISLSGIKDKSGNWFDSLLAKFRKDSSASPLDRPLGISLNYNNQRSKDWVGMEYSDIETTLLEFRP